MGERQNGPLGLQLHLDKIGYAPNFRPFGQSLRLVLPGPLGTPDWHIAAGHNRGKEAKHRDPPAGKTKLEKFKQDLIAKQVASREKKGKKRVEGLTDGELGDIPRLEKYKMRKDVALLFGAMWKEASEEFLSRVDGSPQDSIGVASTYRSVERDAIAWNNAFPKYLKATREDRLATGNEFGKKALQIIFDFMDHKKAPAGFSGHTHGIAADLTTREGGQVWTVNSDYAHQVGWQKTWLYGWLVAHAWKHNFYQLKTETWHWEYHPDGASGQCWDGKKTIAQRPVKKS
jgi:hypothetical protein